jgi:hypothetical protein
VNSRKAPGYNPAEVVHTDQEIVLTVRQEIGRVRESPGSDMPMVVGAFLVAGEYLNEQAGLASTTEATVDFTYLGVHFTAGFKAE